MLGDPSLKIGGYPPSTSALDTEDIIIGDIELGIGGTNVETTITNDGDENLTYCDWEIKIEGASPLGRYFGLAGTIFGELFRGRVFRGEHTTEEIIVLYPDESVDISSNSAFGFGHVEVNVTVLDTDGETLVYKTEDGFLFGNHFILKHAEE